MLLLTICGICFKTSLNVCNLASPMPLPSRGWRVLILRQLPKFPRSYRTDYRTAKTLQNLTELGLGAFVACLMCCDPYLFL